MKVRTVIAVCFLALCLGAAWIAGNSALPSLENRTASTALFAGGDSRLGKAISPMVAAHPSLSGIYPLSDARDAFAARALLAQAAERTLDIRYYIWRNDISGTLLLEALHAAADRGVRVRLLLDDNNTSGLDTLLAALDSHPNIEVRLFNPFVIRAPRLIGYVTDFFRLNRRMHNKSFTADDQATIIGGRNVGDEYFGATSGVLFADLDVLAIGPVVAEVSKDFDRYWASGSSYPVAGLLPAVDRARISEVTTAALRLQRDPATVAYLNALLNSSFVREWNQGSLVPVWAATRMLSDDPAKALGLAAPEARLFQKLKEIIGDSATEVDLVSPYFVPTSAGVDALAALAKRGVKIRVLTNALEATDVAVVHAGYAKRRKALLENGIALYELRRLSPDVAARKSEGRFGSSGASLHAKTFLVDRSRIFVGSFNFDPRSAELNTEMGFVIDSAAVVQAIAAAPVERLPLTTYQVGLADTGQLYWIERRGDESVRHDTEPGTSAWQRARVWLLSLLPVEWLL
jgi:putative cardiolipin synthase